MNTAHQLTFRDPTGKLEKALDLIQAGRDYPIVRSVILRRAMAAGLVAITAGTPEHAAIVAAVEGL